MIKAFSLVVLFLCLIMFVTYFFKDLSGGHGLAAMTDFILAIFTSGMIFYILDDER